MVGKLGISDRFVPFVSNLVEKGTFELISDKELQSVGLSADEVASFAVIRDWAAMRSEEGSEVPQDSRVRRQLRDVSAARTQEAAAAASAAAERGDKRGEARLTAGAHDPPPQVKGDREGHQSFCPKLPAVPNAAVVYSNERAAPSDATFSCEEGYAMEGESLLRCVPAGHSAMWDAPPPKCVPVAGSAPGDADTASGWGSGELDGVMYYYEIVRALRPCTVPGNR